MALPTLYGRTIHFRKEKTNRDIQHQQSKYTRVYDFEVLRNLLTEFPKTRFLNCSITYRPHRRLNHLKQVSQCRSCPHTYRSFFSLDFHLETNVNMYVSYRTPTHRAEANSNRDRSVAQKTRKNNKKIY